jgi:predicted ATPase/DNA-binding SARP family transcriptional activator
MQEMLEVRLLGNYDIRFMGEPVELSTRASQSLFAYLILSPGIRHRREKLAGLFWPEVSEKKARTYLRQELWRIRKEFAKRAAVDYVIADDMVISFNDLAKYQLDVDALKKLSENASAHELMEALTPYNGELLPGFYDDWVSQEREHLHSLYEERMAQLVEILIAERRWQEVLQWAESWTSRSPASEAAYQTMMLAYKALGEPAKVVTTYERCVKALQDLDLQPSEKTRSLLVQRSHKLNIPIPLTSFIGRENELQVIASLVSRSRLVTLTGSGGVGKTRLAIQTVADVLNQFPDGIWFLDLAPLSDATLIPNTLANLVGLQESNDQRFSIPDLLVNYFRSRTTLVIFDNCEHLIEACAWLIHSLLTSCEHLSILATSREPLRIAGEIAHRVPSLEIPKVEENSDISLFMENESVRLFAARAATDSPRFALTPHNVFTIAQICHRLDGIPLAIELAAARVAILSLEQILQRLDDRFNLLTGGLRSSLPRHQTLRATIEWSYDLLAVKERILFRRLAVFSGSWTLEAAETVCSGDGIHRAEILDLISQLVNKSLVVAGHENEEEQAAGAESLRYRRLEIIREFAREKLVQATEAGRLMDRHLEYFLIKAEEIEPHLYGSEQVDWLDIVDADLGDIRLALEWSIATQKKEAALRLFSAISWYWFIRCRFHEGEEWFRRLQPFIKSASMQMRAKALTSGVWLYLARDEFATMLEIYRQSLDIYRELADDAGISNCLQHMGIMEFELQHFTRAKSLLEESLEVSRRANNKATMPRALMFMGYFAEMEGDTAAAQHYFEESVAIAREVGEGHLMMIVIGSLGDFACEQKNYSLARDYHREALEIGIRLKNKRTVALQFLDITRILNAEGHYLESARLQGFADSLLTETEALTEKHLTSIRQVAELPIKHLGEKRYRKQYNIGKSLTLEQATGIALNLSDQA